MRKLGNIHILLHKQIHVKCECQSEILLKIKAIQIPNINPY